MYKIGLHIHTSLSDGKATPERAAEIYKNAGYDAIAITDHWKYYPEGELNGLKILSGCEYNFGGGDTAGFVIHIVGIGMKYDPAVDKDATPQETVNAIKDAGGMAVLAHPAWSLNTVEQISAIEGFEMLEIYNSVSDAHESARPYSGYVVDVLANKGMTYPLTATDDVHYYDGSDETKSFIMVDAHSLEWDDIAAAIRERRFYATQGPELKLWREGECAIAECSGCDRIAFFTNMSWASGRVYKGSGLTRAEYKICPLDKWIRAEVRDADGREAWSNIISL